VLDNIVTMFDLLDPAHCGENLTDNFRTAAKIGPKICVGCADYHVSCAAHRAVGTTIGVTLDRPALVAEISQQIAQRLRQGDGAINIVIPGSADTAILSTAAHAAAVLGGDAIDRCQFTVLDLCPTPLRICEKFATQHGLRIETAVTDLMAIERSFDADVIIIHSVFRFIPTDLQDHLLAVLGSWLRPGGAMIFSHRIRGAGATESSADDAKRERANQRVRDILVPSSAMTDLDWTDILPRLDRSVSALGSFAGEFRDEAALRVFLDRSPLTLRSFKDVSQTIGERTEYQYTRKRILALLVANAPEATGVA
jgi:hypothetical protein